MKGELQREEQIGNKEIRERRDKRRSEREKKGVGGERLTKHKHIRRSTLPALFPPWSISEVER